ncbi:MAG: nuclear transport factor 2 family protein [Burkholderiaceae bacterium]
MSSFATLIRKLTAAIVSNDGSAACACFTESGCYDDVFYGRFVGADIATLVNKRIHRDGRDFRWDIHEPVDDGQTGYARYVFSFTSALDEFKGQRVVFQGVAICTLESGLIAHYREIADAAPGLHQLGFGAERLAKFAGKEAALLRERSDAASHLT